MEVDQVQDVPPAPVKYPLGLRGVDVVIDVVAQELRHVIDIENEVSHVEDHVRTRLVTQKRVTDMNVKIMEIRSLVDAGAFQVIPEPVVSMVSELE